MPPSQEIRLNGTKYVTIDTQSKIGQKAYLWDPAAEVMKVFVIMENARHCREGHDTYHCAMDPTAEPEDYHTKKHKDLYMMSTENDSRILINALHDEMVRKMDVTYFNHTKFNKQIETLKLEGDDVISMARFYNILDDTLRASHSLSYSPMPNLEDLSAGDKIHEYIIKQFPEKSHIYSDAKIYVQQMGLVIRAYLNGPKKHQILNDTICPKSRLAVDILGSTKNGFKILDAALREIFPKMGADVDLTVYVTNLNIYQNETLRNFMRKVQKAEEITNKGGANLANNQLFERCSLLLNSCQDIIPWLVNINTEWDQHRKEHFGEVFQEK